MDTGPDDDDNNWTDKPGPRLTARKAVARKKAAKTKRKAKAAAPKKTAKRKTKRKT